MQFYNLIFYYINIFHVATLTLYNNYFICSSYINLIEYVKHFLIVRMNCF